MVYLVFLGGVLFGCIITRILFRHKTGYGYFKVEPYEDEDGVEGLYRVNVCLSPDQNLLNVKQIILHKDPSQK